MNGLPGSFRRSSTRLLFLDLTAMAEQQQFYLLLGNLMSPDNNVRKQAEVRRGKKQFLVADKFGECWKSCGQVSRS
uniref:Uncharacterized protein n=1 Tax=Neolamprologus brichardi TaxID=32507 RepID=A0A3Q4N4J2_NEOBR